MIVSLILPQIGVHCLPNMAMETNGDHRPKPFDVSVEKLPCQIPIFRLRSSCSMLITLWQTIKYVDPNKMCVCVIWPVELSTLWRSLYWSLNFYESNVRHSRLRVPLSAKTLWILFLRSFLIHIYSAFSACLYLRCQKNEGFLPEIIQSWRTKL